MMQCGTYARRTGDRKTGRNGRFPAAMTSLASHAILTGGGKIWCERGLRKTRNICLQPPRLHSPQNHLFAVYLMYFPADARFPGQFLGGFFLEQNQVARLLA